MMTYPGLVAFYLFCLQLQDKPMIVGAANDFARAKITDYNCRCVKDPITALLGSNKKIYD